MAQLVARLVRNEKVGGSNPPSSTTGVGLIARPFVYLQLFWVEKFPVTSVRWPGFLFSRALPRGWAWGLEGRVKSCLALLLVIEGASDGFVAQDDDHGQVDQGHEAHQDVANVPCDRELQQCACEDQQRSDGAEDCEYPVRSGLIAEEESQVYLGVVEVANQGSETEEQ